MIISIFSMAFLIILIFKAKCKCRSIVIKDPIDRFTAVTETTSQVLFSNLLIPKIDISYYLLH